MTEAVGGTLEVGEDEGPLRLDLFLARRLGLSRAAAHRLVRDGLVELDRLPARRPAAELRGGQVVSVLSVQAAAEQLPQLNFVYQDRDLAVVDKPAGVVVHPGAGHRGDTLADALQAEGGPWSELGGASRAGIVHRLDRDTSGLLVLARTDEAHRRLSEQLRARSMGREYWGLACGQFKEERGRIEAAVGRDPRMPRRMAVSGQGREAVTEFWVLERMPQHTVVRLRLLTGRTHQIRVHLAYVGKPLHGDELYQGRKAKGKPALHAAMLHLTHPRTGLEMTFVSELPPGLLALRSELGGQGEPVWPWPRQSMVGIAE